MKPNQTESVLVVDDEGTIRQSSFQKKGHYEITLIWDNEMHFVPVNLIAV